MQQATPDLERHDDRPFHIHPFQSERFEVLEGTLEFRRGRRKVTATAGDVVTVEPGTVHSFRNVGDTPASFVCEVRPALQFERFIETMFGLAADGKTNRKGMPSPLRLAVIADARFDDLRPALRLGVRPEGRAGDGSRDRPPGRLRAHVSGRPPRSSPRSTRRCRPSSKRFA